MLVGEEFIASVPQEKLIYHNLDLELFGLLTDFTCRSNMMLEHSL